jgi:hypothetical protein
MLGLAFEAMAHSKFVFYNSYLLSGNFANRIFLFKVIDHYFYLRLLIFRS